MGCGSARGTKHLKDEEINLPSYSVNKKHGQDEKWVVIRGLNLTENNVIMGYTARV